MTIQVLQSDNSAGDQSSFAYRLSPERYGNPSRPLFYIVDWLPPDFGAVGQYAVLLSREFARSGREVILVGLSSSAASNEIEHVGAGTLEIHRLSSRRYNKTSSFERLLWTIATNTRLVAHVLRRPESRGAALLFTGAPPFMLFFAVFARFFRDMHLIYRITDFFPEVILAERERPSLLLKCLNRLTWRLRRLVETFEALGQDQMSLLIAGGIAAKRIVLKRDFSPVVITGSETPHQKPPELGGRLALLYSGNFGIAHDIDTVVEGLILHHRNGSDRFALWLNAVGSGADVVVERLMRAAVPFARTRPVPLADLPALLAAADAHLISLRPAFSGIVLPSKIYACLQSKRSIMFVGPASSDVHLLCAERAAAYVRVEPGDAAGFVAALDHLPIP